MMFRDNFSNNEKYKLFRNMFEVIHPSISKKNISNYRIVLDEEILPIRVFYPGRLSSINSVILFIPGEGNLSNCYGEYDNILKDMAIKLDKLVISLDYFDEVIKYPYLFDKCYDSVDFILNELNNNGISLNNVILMGDSFGGNLVSGITLKRIEEKKDNCFKEVLIYPLVSGEYFGKTKFESLNRDGLVEKNDLVEVSSFFKRYISNKKRLSDKFICPLKCKDFSDYPNTLVMTADLDILRDEGICFYEALYKYNDKCSYYNVLFGGHGFLDFYDEEIKEEVYLQINNFISN